MRVLVVDDNQNAAEALAAFLAFEDMDIRVAFNGAEAISLALAWGPHVVIMDIAMPACNGFEAALALRQNVQTSGVAIIAFTAFDETEVRRHITDHEFDAYCQKGQAPAHLVALISNMTA